MGSTSTIDKHNQRRAIAMEMTANGYSDVRIEIPGTMIDLPDLTLDIVGRRDDKILIIEMADNSRTKEESVMRFETISDKIKGNRKIDMEIRFYDAADDMLKAWISLRRKIAAKIKKGEDVAAHEGVLGMMDGLKKSFMGF